MRRFSDALLTRRFDKWRNSYMRVVSAGIGPERADQPSSLKLPLQR